MPIELERAIFAAAYVYHWSNSRYSDPTAGVDAAVKAGCQAVKDLQPTQASGGRRRPCAMPSVRYDQPSPIRPVATVLWRADGMTELERAIFAAAYVYHWSNYRYCVKGSMTPDPTAGVDAAVKAGCQAVKDLQAWMAAHPLPESAKDSTRIAADSSD